MKDMIMLLVKYLFCAVLCISLNACKKTEPAPTPLLKSLEVVATHAFDTQQPVSAISFVPNNIAPWVGNILILGADEKLFSTGIEGSSFTQIGTGYKDVFGLSRDNAAGMALTINNNNMLGAIIESDDNGNFIPMVLKGKTISAVAFCKTSSAPVASTKILTETGVIMDIEIITHGENSVELKSGKSRPALQGAEQCAYDDQSIYSHSQTQVGIYKEGSWSRAPFHTNGITPVNFGENYIGLVKAGTVSLRTSGDMKQGRVLSIVDGLSIRGTSHVDFSVITTANYGGAAFKDGVAAFVDTQENRIVFISLDYMSRRLNAQHIP